MFIRSPRYEETHEKNTVVPSRVSQNYNCGGRPWRCRRQSAECPAGHTAEAPPRENRRDGFLHRFWLRHSVLFDRKRRRRAGAARARFQSGRQLLRHRQLLDPPRHRTAERKTDRRIFQIRRREIFLATKFDPRHRDGALRSVDTGLKFLQTDYLDLIQIHSLSNRADLDKMSGHNGVVAAVEQLKNYKVGRFIGITGDNDGAAMAEALRRHDFDTVMMSLNAAHPPTRLRSAKWNRSPPSSSPPCRWRCRRTWSSCR